MKKLPEFDFEYKIIRGKGKGFRGQRKTLSIYVRNDANASVEVHCGLNTPDSVIEDFLLQKSSWINKTRAKVLQEIENTSLSPNFSLTNGAELLLLGQICPLIFEGSGAPCFNGKQFVLPTRLEGNTEALRATLKNIYKQIARKYLTSLVQTHAEIMDVQPTGIKITSAHTRWGSCSAKNSLNFSYKLMMAEPECIRYVVIHELAHIRHHDHSTRFWSLVASHAPDYRAQAARLKALARSPWFQSV